MSWSKPKSSARRISALSKNEGRRRPVKPSVLDNQRVQPRVRNKLVSKKTESNTPRLFSRRSGAAYQYFARGALEKAFLLLAGLSIVIKSGLDFLVDLLLSGRELFVRMKSDDYTFDEEEMPEGDRLEPEMDPELDLGADSVLEPNIDLGTYFENEKSEEDVNWDSRSEVPREDIERSKMTVLENEEEDLPDELLEDQAGALRSLFSGDASKEDDASKDGDASKEDGFIKNDDSSGE